jgi:uroporphyrinogen decarboxylase
MMHCEPSLFHDVMDRLATSAITFIDAQLSAGASAFQLFDSWAGSLALSEYRRFVLPHSSRVFTELRTLHPDAPCVHFGIGCDHLLESMYDAMPVSGPRVLGLDWRTPISDARRRMGDDLVVQGNLDPALVLAGVDAALDGTDRVLADNLDAAGVRRPGHVFNLGHGVHQDSDPDVLQAVVDRVHETTNCTRSA